MQDLLKSLFPSGPVRGRGLVTGQVGAAGVSRIEACSTEMDLENETVTWRRGQAGGLPLHVKSTSVQNFLNNISGYLSKHKALVEGTVVIGGRIAAEFFGGLVLMLFVMFFLIKDGERIWAWLLGTLRTQTARRVDRAGHAAWLAVVYYMRGTVAVAAIHAIVVGVVLSVMGVPLAFPLAVLVFLAFVPPVGLLVAGALAILVTLATKGWVDAVILLGILIVEDQLGGPPAPAAGGRAGDPAALARGHPRAGGRRRAGRHRRRCDGGADRGRDHPAGARAAAARTRRSRPRGPVRCAPVPWCHAVLTVRASGSSRCRNSELDVLIKRLDPPEAMRPPADAGSPSAGPLETSTASRTGTDTMLGALSQAGTTGQGGGPGNGADHWG